jgi:hypothetical protein
MHSANIGGGGGGAGPTVVKLPEDGVEVCKEGKSRSGKGGGAAGGETGEGEGDVVVPEKKIHWKKKAAAARHAGMVHDSLIDVIFAHARVVVRPAQILKLMTVCSCAALLQSEAAAKAAAAAAAASEGMDVEDGERQQGDDGADAAADSGRNATGLDLTRTFFPFMYQHRIQHLDSSKFSKR